MTDAELDDLIHKYRGPMLDTIERMEADPECGPILTQLQRNRLRMFDQIVAELRNRTQETQP